MKRLTVNGVGYAYNDSGTPNSAAAGVSKTLAPPLLLLHGFTGSHQSWQTLRATLPGSRRMIAVDLLGHGQTDAPEDPARYAMARGAADLLDLMTACGIHRFDLLGYSMGGRLALYIALAHPDRVRQLVLESASPGLSEPAARRARVDADEALADSIERDGIEPFVDRWEVLPLFAGQRRLPAAIQAAVRDQRLANQPRGLANSLRGMGTGRQPSLWARLGDVQAPTLLLAGRNDAKFVGLAQAMEPPMPQARVHVIPDAGHTIHLEQPELYAKVVEAFLHREIGQG